jgi:hypothetical protein
MRAGLEWKAPQNKLTQRDPVRAKGAMWSQQDQIDWKSVRYVTLQMFSVVERMPRTFRPFDRGLIEQMWLDY